MSQRAFRSLKRCWQPRWTQSYLRSSPDWQNASRPMMLATVSSTPRFTLYVRAEFGGNGMISHHNKVSEGEIDEVVEAQADDDSAWGKPVRVHRTESASVSLPSELAARAAFFARLHREADVEDWL